jgi:hypothetical protein
MAYTKYSLTPADNNAAPPNGAPEGMLPSGVNDTMRDMMSQIRDVGDGIRGGTYTMTAPVITGGSVTGVTFSSGAATITGGSITGITDLAVADGGTGASTAANARLNLSAVGFTTTTGSVIINSGTTAQRDGSPADGYFRYNTDLDSFEGYVDGAWGGVGGAQAGGVIYENGTTISADYTFGAGKNGHSVGPITIASGVSVTVGSGQRWVIA